MLKWRYAFGLFAILTFLVPMSAKERQQRRRQKQKLNNLKAGAGKIGRPCINGGMLCDFLLPLFPSFSRNDAC